MLAWFNDRKGGKPQNRHKFNVRFTIFSNLTGSTMYTINPNRNLVPDFIRSRSEHLTHNRYKIRPNHSKTLKIKVLTLFSFHILSDFILFSWTQCPDLFYSKGDDWFFCEVKGKGDRQSREQSEYVRNIEQMRGFNRAHPCVALDTQLLVWKAYPKILMLIRLNMP